MKLHLETLQRHIVRKGGRWVEGRATRWGLSGEVYVYVDAESPLAWGSTGWRK